MCVCVLPHGRRRNNLETAERREPRRERKTPKKNNRPAVDKSSVTTDRKNIRRPAAFSVGARRREKKQKNSSGRLFSGFFFHSLSLSLSLSLCVPAIVKAASVTSPALVVGVQGRPNLFLQSICTHTHTHKHTLTHTHTHTHTQASHGSNGKPTTSSWWLCAAKLVGFGIMF